jgi:pilus assembly protein CpaB
MLFAALAAGVSSLLLYRIITGYSGGGKSATTKVLVAAHDLDAGAMVSASDIRTVDWPAMDGAHWIASQSDVVGHALLTAVAKDEPFAESRLAAKGAGAGMASRIPPGMRVIAVHVDELTGLSRFILQGMHVDVISTGSTNGQGMIARTILQNIEVFSTGQSIERDAKEKASAVPTFNLLVTPQQAVTLSQAVAQARIELVLRNPLDKANLTPETPEESNSPTGGGLIGAVLSNASKTIAGVMTPPVGRQKAASPVAAAPAQVPVTALAPAAPPPPPPEPTVEIIQGTKRSFNPVASANPGSK